MASSTSSSSSSTSGGYYSPTSRRFRPLPSLPTADKAHLMRTTRKLGALLGETPLVLEPPSPSTRAHHGHGHGDRRLGGTESRPRVIDPAPRGPSLAPAHSPSYARSPSPADQQRPQLFLLRRPNDTPLGAVSVASPSPRSNAFPPLSASPNTPTTPITPVVVVDKRKKMAKLVRTLGSNPPHEMVFSAASKAPPVPSKHVVPSILTALAPNHGRPAALRRKTSREEDWEHEALASATREAVAFAYYEGHGSHRSASPSSASAGRRTPSSSPLAPPSPHYIPNSQRNGAPMSPLPSPHPPFHGRPQAPRSRTSSYPHPPALMPGNRSMSSDSVSVSSSASSLHPSSLLPGHPSNRQSTALHPLYRTGSSDSTLSTSTGSSSAGSGWVPVSTSSAPTSPRISPTAYGNAYIPNWNASADDLQTTVHVSKIDEAPAHESTTSRATHDARYLSRHIEFRGASPDSGRSAHAHAHAIREDEDEWERVGDVDDGMLKPSTYRREERQGWSGEWTGVGQGGMEDVVAKLRNLK